MKLSVAATLLAVSMTTIVSAFSTCQLDCMTQAATTADCGSNYNATSCFCDNDNFATAVKACLYGGSCTTDVSDFYSERTSTCGSSVATYSYAAAKSSAAVAAAATATSASTASSDSTTLTTCQTECMTSAAASNCSSSITDYNDTSCLCSDAFSTTAKACLYSSGCSTDVGTFFSYQTAQCGDLVDTYTYASAATAAAVSSATSTSTTSSPASKLSNAASGGIGAGVTVAVLAALLAALYAGGLVRFGKQRSAVALDSASVTSSESRTPTY